MGTHSGGRTGGTNISATSRLCGSSGGSSRPRRHWPQFNDSADPSGPVRRLMTNGPPRGMIFGSQASPQQHAGDRPSGPPPTTLSSGPSRCIGADASSDWNRGCRRRQSVRRFALPAGGRGSLERGMTSRVASNRAKGEAWPCPRRACSVRLSRSPFVRSGCSPLAPGRAVIQIVADPTPE